MSAVSFIVGDAREVVPSLAPGSVDLVLTSPPFLALRNYLPTDHPDKGLEVGQEGSPGAFVQALLAMVADWRQVLGVYGSIAVELGDTYAGSGGAGGDYRAGHQKEGQPKFKAPHGQGWPLAKSLTLVPEAFRIGLAYGRNPLTGQESPAGLWRVRNVVRWVRPNPPVGALGDKYRIATSDLVIATVRPDRWFDLEAARKPGRRTAERPSAQHLNKGAPGYHTEAAKVTVQNAAGAPPLDWWRIPSRPYKGQHYATFPPELCRVPIETMAPRSVCRLCNLPSRRIMRTLRARNPYGKEGKQATQGRHTGGKFSNSAGTVDLAIKELAGWTACQCPGADGLKLDGWHTGEAWRRGLVLDPFAGTFTTGLMALALGRDALGIDLDARNAELARERVGMFLEVSTYRKAD